MTNAVKLSLLGLVLSGSVAACSHAALDDIEAQDAESEALTAPGNFTYFTVRPDLRRCAAPLCGGYFVKAVNVASTRCADGSAQAECYVTELDLSALDLSEKQREYLRGHSREFLLRGSIVHGDSVSSGKLGAFGTEEAWRGHEGVVPSGAFVRANETGIVCVTHPCPIFSASVLNKNASPLRVAEIDLTAVAIDPSDGLAQLGSTEGLLLAATRRVVTGPAGNAIGLDATEYYVPFEARPKLCGSRGLPACDEGSYCDFAPEASCGRADAPGVCTPRPDVCTKQYDPVCGCDGRTYGNACVAAAAGVSVERPGECSMAGSICGTILGLTCEEGEYCDFGTGQCQVSDAAGLCRAQPELCPQIFAPVCGCNGKTYSNACVAAAAGAQIDHEGSCH